MAIKSILESLGVYIPQGRLSTKDAVEGCKVKPTVDMEELTGIKKRPVVGENEYSLDLAVKAVDKCFEISHYDPWDMDMVICANICRYNGHNYKVNYEPCSAAQLARHFSFGNAILFDVSNACAGMFTAFNVLDSFIKTGTVKRGLVVSGEYITHLINNAQKEISSSVDLQFASLTLGDSGAAYILEGTDDPNIGFHHIEMFTSAEHCWLCVGEPSKKGNPGYVMNTDSIGIHTHLISLGTDLILRTIKGTPWEDNNCNHYIQHQTASRAIHAMSNLLNNALGKKVFTKDNAIVNLTERGNTSSTSHFVALWDHINNGRITSHDNIIFSILASGVNIGVALYTLDDLPERIIKIEQRRCYGDQSREYRYI